jgi:small subunit ribosomal protein S16
MYDIVAVDGRKKRDGAFIERLGYFNPHAKPSKISINPERAIYWLNNGAQATDIVNKLLSYEGVLLRRHLEFKGKTSEEIASEVEKHLQNAKARYFRRNELRVKRAAKRAKEKEAEAEAKAE